jgi:hypothetical protein
MWTATITAVTADKVAGVANVTFEYTDGQQTIVRTERVSDPGSVLGIARNAIGELERLEAVAAFVADPPLGLIEL